jgi:hypothetical protein
MGKEQVEDGNSPTKVTREWALIETKEIQKMLQWIWMGSKKWQWLEQADLGNLFTIHWTFPRLDLLGGILRTWESTKDGQIKAIVNGEKITIDQTLIMK